MICRRLPAPLSAVVVTTLSPHTVMILGVGAGVEVSVAWISGGDGASAGGVQNQRTLTGRDRRIASLCAATHRYGDIARRRSGSGRIHRHSPLNSYRLPWRRRIGIVRRNRRRRVGLIHRVRRGRR